MSTQNKILEHLKKHRTINQLEAWELYNTFSLAKIIKVLRDKGYEISTILKKSKKGTTYAEYVLNEESIEKVENGNN